MSGASPARGFLTAALLALFAPVYAGAEPIATEVTTLDSVWSFSARVYEPDAPDNPAPIAGTLTYVYQLTALGRMSLLGITVVWKGETPVSTLGFVEGSGTISPYDFFQGQTFGYHGVVYDFSFEGLDALDTTDLLYAHSADLPGPAFFTIQQGAVDEPAALRTLGPSVAEPGLSAILAVALAATALSRPAPLRNHEVTRCS